MREIFKKKGGTRERKRDGNVNHDDGHVTLIASGQIITGKSTLGNPLMKETEVRPPISIRPRDATTGGEGAKIAVVTHAATVAEDRGEDGKASFINLIH